MSDIKVMRKYQKIQKVLEKVWNTPSCMLDEAECLNEIMETYRTVRQECQTEKKHLKVLEELRKTLNVDKGIEFGEEIEALDYGLNTMRKYQKIEQILDDCDLEAWEVLEKIKKVVEDG